LAFSSLEPDNMADETVLDLLGRAGGERIKLDRFGNSLSHRDSPPPRFSVIEEGEA